MRGRILADIAARSFDVIRVLSRHFQEAESLIVRRGLTQNMRTLGALQHAVALDLRRSGMLDHFVCADRDLCAIAAAESVPVINPEIP